MKKNKNKELVTPDPKAIGKKLLEIRKKSGLSPEETAWEAGLSSRAYADIERGEVNARLDTIIKICNVFDVTPNDILSIDATPDSKIDQSKLYDKLNNLGSKERYTALKLLNVYVESL